jgi:glycosyltransferase involved in cell wall biosynthesis
MCQEKGWRVLLAALTRVPPAVKVAIAGAGPDVPELLLWASTAHLADRVHYFGSLPKSDLYSLYRQLDALAVPSLTTPRWSEQFGAVLTEAMGHGVPVVASASGAIPEVLADCGRTIPEGDPLALAEVLNDWVHNPTDRLAAARDGRARYMQVFSLDAYSARLAGFFRALTGENVGS